MVVSDLGYWKSASQQRSGGVYLPRTPKTAPVIEVDSPEAQEALLRFDPWSRALFVRPDDLSSYWSKPKLAPVVAVSSPQEEKILERQFPYDHPTFVQSMGSAEDVEKNAPIFIGAGVASILIGYIGWHFRNHLPNLSPFMIGASGSILGAAVYGMIQELHR